MWPPLLYSDLPYHIISTPTRPYTGDFGDSHGDFGDFTYPNSSLPNPTTPNPPHPYPDLPYHIISTLTRPYNGDFGDSHGDFGGDFGDFGFSGDPALYIYIVPKLTRLMRLWFFSCGISIFIFLSAEGAECAESNEKMNDDTNGLLLVSQHRLDLIQ